MAHSTDPSTDPIIQPRVIRRLKDRRRVVDFGFREEFLDELDNVLCEMRRPDRIAERSVKSIGQRTQRASARVVQRAMEKGNQSVFRNL